ncbi:MAG TPA: hypothetical protein VGH45_09520 [Solirubrobacteraceae bacterium]
MNVENVSRDDWILGGVALLLVIDLLFLPWFSISVGPFSSSLTATDSPDGWLGILAVLTAIVLIADLAVDRTSPQTQLPAVNNSRTQTRLIEACVVALFVALKFLFHIHFDLFGFGFWAGVVLTIALVYLALQARNAGLRTTRRGRAGRV